MRSAENKPPVISVVTPLVHRYINARVFERACARGANVQRLLEHVGLAIGDLEQLLADVETLDVLPRWYLLDLVPALGADLALETALAHELVHVG